MRRANPAGLIALLAVLGAGWGMTQPLAKIAVSEGYRHFGLVFWQLAIGAAALGLLNALRGRGLPVSARHMRLYLLIALIGTVLPNSASYQAAVHLPSGVLSILLSLVPIFAFPIALGLGIDRFSARRLAGLAAGLMGVVLLVAPEASLPDRAMVAWIPVALIAPFFYGLEGNVVAKWGTAGLDPIQLLFGASLVGMGLAAPLALATGQWIAPPAPADWGAPDIALVASALIHASVYAGYVWLVGRAGSVFAAQVSYLVTAFGILWARLLLGESYSPWIWASLGLIMAGLVLVQPRPRGGLAPLPPIPDTAPRT
ncbi:MAG: DMT family transporter [Paracoccaceae bacterium]